MRRPAGPGYGRGMWELGDYHRFAKATVWPLGPELVAACEIGPGQRVLDVAAGTGNVAIRAAEAGATVVASDITPENFAAGREEARAHGVELEWVQADAQALPFADGEFDAVTSCFGAIFAPDHEAVARELARVCRPGGRIGLLAFRPVGASGEFFSLFEAPAPALWGDEDHVRGLFGDRAELTLTRSSYLERVDGGPEGYVAFFLETFGPAIAVRSDPFERDFLAFAARHHDGAGITYDYLRVVGVRR
jgi:SAM-dependent methyltransferase